MHRAIPPYYDFRFARWAGLHRQPNVRARNANLALDVNRVIWQKNIFVKQPDCLTPNHSPCSGLAAGAFLRVAQRISDRRPDSFHVRPVGTGAQQVGQLRQIKWLPALVHADPFLDGTHHGGEGVGWSPLNADLIVAPVKMGRAVYQWRRRREATAPFTAEPEDRRGQLLNS